MYIIINWTVSRFDERTGQSVDLVILYNSVLTLHLHQSQMPRCNQGMRREDLAVHVRREAVFEESFRELHRRSAEEWKNRFYIVFEVINLQIILKVRVAAYTLPPFLFSLSLSHFLYLLRSLSHFFSPLFSLPPILLAPS